MSLIVSLSICPYHPSLLASLPGYILRQHRAVVSKFLLAGQHRHNIALLANTPTLLHSLEQAAGSIGLHMNAEKTEYMYFKQEGDISTLNGDSLKLVNKFMQLGSSVLSIESDVYRHLEVPVV